jgi:hypothetical protein
MENNPSKIFISHIAEEAELALRLKSILQQDFGSSICIFVSSDIESIAAGEIWLQAIDRALNESQFELILCSKRSITRHWIHFEAGAGWIKDIAVIPICHTDMVPKDLPPPLSFLQAIKCSEASGLFKLYDGLAKILKCPRPEPNFDQHAFSMKEIEEKYIRRVIISSAMGTFYLFFAPVFISLIYLLALVAYPENVYEAGAVLITTSVIIPWIFAYLYRLSRAHFQWGFYLLAGLVTGAFAGLISTLFFQLFYPNRVVEVVLSQKFQIVQFIIFTTFSFLGGGILGQLSIMKGIYPSTLWHRGILFFQSLYKRNKQYNEKDT